MRQKKLKTPTPKPPKHGGARSGAGRKAGEPNKIAKPKTHATKALYLSVGFIADIQAIADRDSATFSETVERLAKYSILQENKNS